jgi:hypothetical protein
MKADDIPHAKVKAELSLYEQERFNLCLIDLRKFHGLPPYDGGDNPCRHDAFYWNSIEGTTSPGVLARAKAAVETEKLDWEAFRKRYIKRWKLK